MVKTENKGSFFNLFCIYTVKNIKITQFTLTFWNDFITNIPPIVEFRRERLYCELLRNVFCRFLLASSSFKLGKSSFFISYVPR